MNPSYTTKSYWESKYEKLKKKYYEVSKINDELVKSITKILNMSDFKTKQDLSDFLNALPKEILVRFIIEE